MFKCDYCGKPTTLVCDKGFPLYYFGAGPNDPENAAIYFCGASCAWLERDKRDIRGRGGKAS